MAHKYEAPKYDAKLTREQVKAAIIADLKAAVKSGQLPPCKPTVREGRGGYTMSLHVTLRDFGLRILDAERVRFDVVEPNVFRDERQAPRYTSWAFEARGIAEAIAGAYNDTQSDYFHCGYYLHVDFDSAQMAREREAIVHGASAKRAAVETEVRDALRVANDARLARGEKPLDPIGDILWVAQNADRTLGCKDFAARVHAHRADLKNGGEDWDSAAGAAAQAALYASPLQAAPAAAPVVKMSPAAKAWATRRANAAKAVAS